MESDPKGNAPKTSRTLGVRALAASLLLFALPGETPSQGKREPSGRPPGPPPLCGESHRGSGETTPVDLGKVRRAYADLKTRLGRALSQGKGEPRIDPDPPYDAGLPACGGESERTLEISGTRASRLRGRTLYFLRANDPGALRLPPEVERRPEAVILIVWARRLSDLPELARRLGRPVGLGSAALARALGVRCASTWVRFSEKGDWVELHESR